MKTNKIAFLIIVLFYAACTNASERPIRTKHYKKYLVLATLGSISIMVGFTDFLDNIPCPVTPDNKTCWEVFSTDNNRLYCSANATQYSTIGDEYKLLEDLSNNERIPTHATCYPCSGEEVINCLNFSKKKKNAIRVRWSKFDGRKSPIKSQKKLSKHALNAGR